MMSSILMAGIVAGTVAGTAVVTVVMQQSPAYCPRCGARLPRFRKPASFHQVLWGGWTCRGCGCEVDRHRQERSLEKVG